MNFAEPHFAEPRWLWMAFLAPLLLLMLQRYAALRRRQDLAHIVAPDRVRAVTLSHSSGRRLLKEALLILTAAGLGIAMARPQWGQQAEKSHSLGHDVVFLLDCSRSMLAADILPNRLQRAKLAILDFVQRHAHGRVGLVAFAGQAFLQCPLTFDYGAFSHALSTLEDRTIPIPGTDVARALDEAFHATSRNPGSKIFVLVTDGEDLQGKGLRQAEQLAKEGVVIFTIGVGTAAGSEIQVLNEQGKTELVRDSKGEVVRSRLDEATLRSIAQATRGAYYPLGPLGEGLARVRLALENISGSGPGFVAARKLGIDRFHVPLSIVLLLLIGESLIGTRKRSRRAVPESKETSRGVTVEAR